jgi:hypothetical protein
MFTAVLKTLFKFGYEFYVIRRNNAILKQDNSCGNVIMITAIVMQSSPVVTFPIPCIFIKFMHVNEIQRKLLTILLKYN